MEQKLKGKSVQTTLNIVENKLQNTNNHIITDEEIHEKIAEFIISDCQAYNVVEDESFKALIKLAFPKYKLPVVSFSNLLLPNHMESIHFKLL